MLRAFLSMSCVIIIFVRACVFAIEIAVCIIRTDPRGTDDKMLLVFREPEFDNGIEIFIKVFERTSR
jgi:hypothetical protein